MKRLVLRVTGPALFIGLLLSVTCLTAAWQINRLQRGLVRTLPIHVTAVEAAQKLEILHRELRFVILQERLEPNAELRRQIVEIHTEIESTLAEARGAARDPRQHAVLDEIHQALRTYLKETEADLRPFKNLGEVRRWADDHPVVDASKPCRELLDVNNQEMRDAAIESDIISRWVQAALLLFCLIGPIGGFAGGFGTARSMQQSITRMLVLVRDVHAQLDQQVDLLEIDADPSLMMLDERLLKFVDRVQEVTRQVQQQQQEILRKEQLAAVGQLAAAVAHEIRNPLTGIKLLVEAAQRQNDPQRLTQDDLAMIHREVARLERTVQSLLDYARPPALHAVRKDIRPAIDQAVDMVRSRATQRGVEIRLESPTSEPVLAWHDSDQIASVISNLLLNALDALRQGGTVTVTVDRSRRGAVVRVCDTGPGISPQILPRLFTPFASTKPTGTGLGLSLSQRIACQHGGNLTACNNPAGGACFTLSLPDHGPEPFLCAKC